MHCTEYRRVQARPARPTRIIRRTLFGLELIRFLRFLRRVPLLCLLMRMGLILFVRMQLSELGLGLDLAGGIRLLLY